MQTKVMTFLLPRALIRTQLWCVYVCARMHVCVRACVCVFMCKLHSHCLVASACLDQLSVWYLYGSNFSRRILVMVLCSPIRTHARNVCLCVRHLASRKHCVEVNPSALQYIELCCCVCVFHSLHHLPKLRGTLLF